MNASLKCSITVRSMIVMFLPPGFLVPSWGLSSQCSASVYCHWLSAQHFERDNGGCWRQNHKLREDILEALPPWACSRGWDTPNYIRIHRFHAQSPHFSARVKENCFCSKKVWEGGARKERQGLKEGGPQEGWQSLMKVVGKDSAEGESKKMVLGWIASKNWNMISFFCGFQNLWEILPSQQMFCLGLMFWGNGLFKASALAGEFNWLCVRQESWKPQAYGEQLGFVWPWPPRRVGVGLSTKSVRRGTRIRAPLEILTLVGESQPT